VKDVEKRSSFTVKVNGQEVHGPRKYLIAATMGTVGIVLMMFGMFLVAGAMFFTVLVIGAVVVLSGLCAAVSALLGGRK